MTKIKWLPSSTNHLFVVAFADASMALMDADRLDSRPLSSSAATKKSHTRSSSKSSLSNALNVTHDSIAESGVAESSDDDDLNDPHIGESIEPPTCSNQTPPSTQPSASRVIRNLSSKGFTKKVVHTQRFPHRRNPIHAWKLQPASLQSLLSSSAKNLVNAPESLVAVTDFDVDGNGTHLLITLSSGEVFVCHLWEHLVSDQCDVALSRLCPHPTVHSIHTSFYGAFSCCTWSPDGRLFATGSQDDFVSIFSIHCAVPHNYDASSGSVEEKLDAGVHSATCTVALLARCQGHASFVTDVSFDPFWNDEVENEGSYRIGSVGEDCRLCLWHFDFSPSRRVPVRRQPRATLTCDGASKMNVSTPSHSTIHSLSRDSTLHRTISTSTPTSHSNGSERHLPANKDSVHCAGGGGNALETLHAAPNLSSVPIILPILVSLLWGMACLINLESSGVRLSASIHYSL